MLWLCEGEVASLKPFVDDVYLNEFLSPVRGGIREVLIVSQAIRSVFDRLEIMILIS